MNLRSAILEEHSKAQTNRIVEWIGNDKKRLNELMHLFMTDEYRVVQRSAWMVSMIAQAYPDLLAPYLPELVKMLDDATAHIAVRRNIFRIFVAVDLPESLHGAIMHQCFEALENPKEALAVRAFAVHILTKLMKFYPEIITEFKIILEDFLQYESAPSFKSVANKALREMDKNS
jgi:hypothetical protein